MFTQRRGNSITVEDPHQQHQLFRTPNTNNYLRTVPTSLPGHRAQHEILTFIEVLQGIFLLV